MAGYILYGGPLTRGRIIEMVMAEGDIAYELRQVDMIEQAHRRPEFLAINPVGLLPVLITPEGETLTETPAISLHLAERHGLTHLAPRSDEPVRGAFLSGLFYLTNELEPAMKRFFYPHRYVLRDEDGPAMKQQALEAALERFGVIEQRLNAAGPFHLGKRFGLVDLTMTYWALCLEPDRALDPYPAIQRCMALVMARPKLRATFDAIRAWCEDYAQMQARGEGVK